MSFRFLLTFLIAALPSATNALPPSTSYDLIGYWGQNLAKNQYRSVADYEPPLATLCQTTNYTIYHISFMYLHFDATGLSGIDLDYHCQWPTNKFNGYPNPTKGINVLNCPDVGKDIAVCQALGKKVMISISPQDYLSSQDDAIRSATNVWNLFLGGSSTYRPFGSVVLNGIDLRIWNNDPNPQYYTTFISKIKEFMNADTGRKYYIGGTTLCQYPDVLLGGSNRPSTPLATIPTLFDYLSPYFISSPNICGWKGNNAGFWSFINQWSAFIASFTPNTKLFVGLPSWYTPEWVNAAAGDYIPPNELYDMNVIPTLKNLTGFTGFSLVDTSFDVHNLPCSNFPNRRFSDVLNGQLLLDASAAGVNTPADQKCQFRNQTVGGTTATTTTKSSSTVIRDDNKSCIFLGTCPDSSGWGIGAGMTVFSLMAPALLIVIMGAFF
ncbi:uncharacterized protein SPPG_00753 [Spizellomyces punctatus DAOM BR117]|uniref:GH18 domain-containing protein n=1 Tax=Spizellomyces punctatus (strain DAOM BR117) TaxID=645134 RepID=A0A0L0HVF5_SPIPD|nr:uncharacterized protein SPPG_00753 [Spizellomyces punctatus DAOM BR117]KND05078.1 hypothetical protein SPPG_00753 [Spizellomyces punctatus DAOM BR117]|eukprot:XP_016613117.1 hypothetical protein SPPG_00753 [Spizellomyces punctatus DAOM BR117]